MQKNIILVGLMGAGKSTIGRQLARRCKKVFYDSDTVIVERTGVSIPTIFDIEGEDGFRDREELVIEELSQLSDIVLATGGGSLLRESNRRCLKKSDGQVVYLRASAEQLYSRIKHDKNRPLMQTENPLQTLRDLLKVREGYYLEVADLVVPTGRQRASTISRHIIQRLKKLQDRSHANTRT
uniref:Shikimate kinase n=1 Tax=uncultured Thiotrichaceae bacterium TaxID=298394 RepID=A0A6S6UDI7_9GAMM|nr:MAG: Shikimate kinase I (EC [uncultured Thiotrichaceae bacterium]